MNIDIVNKQVSKATGLAEKKVALLNKFYWRSVYDHLYSYDERPINIENVCVIYTDKNLLKKFIKVYVRKIRRTLVSPKFKPDSTLRFKYIDGYKHILRELWRLRKVNKYTN